MDLLPGGPMNIENGNPLPEDSMQVDKPVQGRYGPSQSKKTHLVPVILLLYLVGPSMTGRYNAKVNQGVLFL